MLICFPFHSKRQKLVDKLPMRKIKCMKTILGKLTINFLSDYQFFCPAHWHLTIVTTGKIASNRVVRRCAIFYLIFVKRPGPKFCLKTTANSCSNVAHSFGLGAVLRSVSFTWKCWQRKELEKETSWIEKQCSKVFEILIVHSPRLCWVLIW